MLLEPQPTRYDLNFGLFGTAVRVHPWFWLLSAILGWGVLDTHPGQYLFLWVMLVFLSVLLHEFGHVWMGRLFGSDGHIVLYSFGGLAVGANDLRARWQRVLVSLAGPAIQFVLCAGVYLWIRSADLPRISEQLRFILGELFIINLFWPLLNLLPIWPLDGGRVCRELCTWLAPVRGERISLLVSVVAAGVLAVNSLSASQGGPSIPYVPGGGLYMTLLFAMFAFESYALLQQGTPWRYEPPDDRMPWER